jgi:hypothetical protein
MGDPRYFGKASDRTLDAPICGFLRAIDNPARGHQLTKAFLREDHHVSTHAAGKLRGNRLRPAPCDAPDLVVTLTPLDRSNSGNSCSYAPVNPPDIRTFTAPIDMFA